MDENEDSQFPAIREEVIGGHAVKTVDGREVHSFLKSKKDYTTWVKDRIKRYGFVENVDYLLTEIGEQLPSGTKYRTEYYLTIGMGKEIGMVERNEQGRAIRKYFIAVEEQSQPKAMTTAEMFLQSAQLLVDLQNGQARQQQELVAINARVQAVEDIAPLKAKPQNAESISEIRKRMNKRFGLPERIVNAVMDLDWAPRPCSMVKNSHEEAQGSSFAVYWIKSVTGCFDRFVAECCMVSATKATHPHIPSKFQLVKGGNI